MYSIVLHAHQKIDAVAYRHCVADSSFRKMPALKDILHFEGRNGPDGVKLKSAGKNEPWHFYDPCNVDDTQLLIQIEEHRLTLLRELRSGSSERAAFEASWLAHAIVDGLTPAHHYPYEQELEQLRGKSKETRETLRSRLLVKNGNRRSSVKKSWQLVGAKGLLTTHTTFEAGAAMIVLSRRLAHTKPTEYDLKTVKHIGFIEYYKRLAKEVSDLSMYERFYARGWTPKLAGEIRDELVTRMVRAVALSWLSVTWELETA